MPSSPAPSKRARDSDRTDTCGVLDTALVDGQIRAEEHEDRTSKAMSAKTIRDLQVLVDDLQIPSRYLDSEVVRPRLPAPPRSLKVAAAVVVVAGIVGALIGSATNSDSPAFGDAPAIPDLATGRGMAQLIEDYRIEFGDTVVDTVQLRTDNATVERADPDQPGTYVSYTYSGEFKSWSTPSPRRTGTRTVDLSTVDVDVLARLIAGAPETLRVPGGVVDQISIDYANDDPLTEPTVYVYVRNEARDSGHLETTLSGEPLSVYPFTP
ncbi:hypothetical protein ABH922_004581 [Rhodococcus sp. 27YEA15]|uniref:DUF1707 SHOCT-like domain-containing protein n=1 Tax=Rhodococcus sp. 27YEA15 TaxID=3156259 RepID=UPI003C7A4D42